MTIRKIAIKEDNFWLQLSRNILQPKRLAIFQASLIGLVAAFAAVLLKTGVGALGGWRVNIASQLPAWLVLPAIGLGGGLLAGWLVQQVAPEAYGSGIPQVKAVLAKVPIPLDLRVAIIKLLGAIIALGSGLPLGREGPTIQVGAALANHLSHIFPTSPDHRRQMIAAGAGAGLAAAFNAPIAGILFVVEELLQDVSSFTLGTAILASFIGAAVSRGLGGHNLVIELAAPPADFSLSEIPFYLVLGILAGSLGALFNRGIIASIKFNRRWLRFGLPLRVGLAGLICGVVIAALPLIFRDSTGLRETLVAGELSAQVVLITFVSQFLLMLIAYGSGAPGGLFVPPMLLGAALGYLVGIAAHDVMGVSSPTTYGLVGMATFLSAVARVPITSIVIVFEMTTDFNLVLPLMIGTAVAYLIAEKLMPGSLYEHLLELNGIHLEQNPGKDGFLEELSAADVMQRRVETLPSQTTIKEALPVFSHSQHRNFPVLENGRVIGILSHKDIANYCSKQLNGNTPINEIIKFQPVTVNPKDTLAHILHTLNRYDINAIPVTEGRKLVGIITHTDIVRVQAEHISGKTVYIDSRLEPSYTAYQTHAPAIGEGRILLPLVHPETMQTLLEMATAIAKDHNYELECLWVILIPRNQTPSEAKVQIKDSIQLLEQAIQFGEERQIPVHTQIRIAHDVAGTVLEVAKERHINLVIMGWEGSVVIPSQIFSHTVDTVFRQAMCDVVLVKLYSQKTFDRWLVATAGGPHSMQAIQLIPALTSLSPSPVVNLYQVFSTDEDASDLDTTVLEQSALFLQQKIKGQVTATSIQASSVPEAIIGYAQQDKSDVIVLGASQERLLNQVMKGNIPTVISRKSDCTVILVRSAKG